MNSTTRIMLIAAMCICAAPHVRCAETETAGTLPPSYAVFRTVPITGIKPQGWIRESLETQRRGLTGNMKACGGPFLAQGWAAPDMGSRTIQAWGAYEPWGYWTDGTLRLGYLLDAPDMVEQARRQIDYVFAHPSEKGLLGPEFVPARWIRTVFFRSCMPYYEATGDRQIIEQLRKHYLADEPVNYDRRGDEVNPFARNVVSIEILGWLYSQTGDRRLLDIAVKAEREYDLLKDAMSDALTHHHGPDYMEKAKLPAILYMWTGDRKYLDAAVNSMRKLDRDHVMVDGCPSGSEGLNGKRSTAVHETCIISDFAWTTGYLLMATGDASYADKIERAVFNASPGAATKDFKAFQYFSGPNQVRATQDSSSELRMGEERMAYQPGHGVPCCNGNINRILPNYAARMWMSDGAGGLAAVLYGPSQFRGKAGAENVPVVITEKTAYPFDEKLVFEMKPERKVKFPFYVRIPGWTKGAQVLVNGQPVAGPAASGSFVKIDREFAPGDVVTVTLPMTVKVTRWQENGVALERGPIAYSLAVKDNRTMPARCSVRMMPGYPAYEMTAASPWNYALQVKPGESPTNVTVMVSKELSDHPWADLDHPPVTLQVKARRVTGWDLIKAVNVWENKNKEVIITPDLPARVDTDGPEETLTLVPLGCTLLRMTVFPEAFSAPVLKIDSYTVSVPAAANHPDATPPSRLTDGQWGGAGSEGVQYNDDVVITSKLTVPATVNEAVVYFYHFKSSMVGSIAAETSLDGVKWESAGTRNITQDAQPGADVPAYELAFPVKREAAYVRFTVKRAPGSSRMILGEIAVR